MANARHSKAGRFVQQRLFSGLSSFTELEQRIADLPDEKSRGDAFEVFAEAYLATQRKHDAETVWPLASVPSELLRNLQLATQDYGVDGVLKTRLGKFSAYQVKFRTGRPALTWRELSTFMGLADSPNIHSRILLTNCDDLPSVLNDRQGFFCIRGSDLDRLEPDDFKAIEAWLADSAYQAPKKTPQPHQAEALDKILPAFNEHDRVSAIMACGTGKTLVALWVTEKMQASRILVLVPSLALLRQILHEWLRETNLPALAYLCVCSDPTVKEGLDTIDTKQSDLDFQVSTDATSVREFLDAAFTGAKIVFSTYQSAQVVGAALKPGEAFDLAVFDEAHKTAGREGRNYGFALEDANLPIRKRLFLTATPRHYNPHQHDREGEAKLLFSMDNPEVYGPQAYRLTFAEAARRGIICGYKVIISVITSEMVTNELLSRGEVVVNGDAVRARQVANQIALRDAIEKYEASKVFTFHRDVKSAQSFVSHGPEGVGTHLADVAADVRRLTSNSQTHDESGKASQSLVTSAATSGFQTFHVNGTMPTAHREREMRDFRSAPQAVMSNARCLTEGVDVPAVDMVAFLSPRRSRVDIVQATGRAMRRSLGKTRGYVLVPLHVELAAGESVEAAVSRSDFDEVWDVLNSLQEQDDVLAEIIRDMRRERGRTRGFDDARFQKFVDVLGPRIGLANLRLAITTACIERLGLSWEERFGELEAFKKRFGHCNVAQDYAANPQLGFWVNAQRNFFRNQTLGAARIQRLQALGFDWNPNETYWQMMFDQLREFKKRKGHCDVPAKYRPNKDLAGWVVRLRVSHDAGKLAPEKVRRLEGIGFEWSPLDAQWDQKFGELKSFKKREGHCRVPQRYPNNPQLAGWVREQRGNKDGLAKERIEKLESIGFEWNPFESLWQNKFEALQAFKKGEGHCNVPEDCKQYRELVSWIRNLRTYYRTGNISPARLAKLNALGFVWDSYETYWQRMISELKTFKKREGHCNVPARYRENPQLGAWVCQQRERFRKGKLAIEKLQELASTGFEWDPFETTWQMMFQKLKAFHSREGHCRIPFRQAKTKELAHWVSTQRQFFRKSKLSQERIRKLESIGFKWEPAANGWEEMVDELKAFKRKAGHCNVPRSNQRFRKLSAWVVNQRRLFGKGKLSKEQIRKLEKTGFEWDPFETAWCRMFDDLKAFKRTQGHCIVPANDSKNAVLRRWVKKQQQIYRNGKLSKDRAKQLNSLGCEFERRRPHERA